MSEYKKWLEEGLYTCGVCGKKFIISCNVEDYAYKSKFKLGDNPIPVCSWSCKRKQDKIFQCMKKGVPFDERDFG